MKEAYYSHRRRYSFACVVRFFLCASTHLLLLISQETNAFVSPTQWSYQQRFKAPVAVTTTKQSQSSSSSSLRMTLNWDEVVYNAESAASAFASQSLQNNPTALWSSLPVMYGAGLLTSISPCVWGLLPLTMSYISTAAGERPDNRTTLPTLAFAAGLASVFGGLGIVASSVGTVFGAATTSGGGHTATTAVLSSDLLVPLLSSSICLAMGLQLLDLIQLPLLNLRPSSTTTIIPKRRRDDSEEPQILIDATGKIIDTTTTNQDNNHDDDENKQASQQNNKGGGSLFRTFLLGGSSALVASPCATPVLTSILAYVAKSQDPVLGFLLLLGYTLGYSTPLLLVAATGGQILANLKGDGNGDDGGAYGKIGPLVTPLTAGILLWYGTNGFLTAIFGDPSLAGLAPVLE